MSFYINKSGLFTTIQDLGRIGYRKYGVPKSGAMDEWACGLANIMLHNSTDCPCLEITLMGPVIDVLAPTQICVCGGNLSPKINLTPIENGKPYLVKKGDSISFGRVISGCRAYLAVKGGFTLSPILNSYSTYVPSAFGGLHGKPIQNGDTLPFTPIDEELFKRKISPALFKYLEADSIRILRGRHFDDFTKCSQNAFLSTPYQLSAKANRMGYRLNGEPVLTQMKKHYPTEGVTIGTIQVPPNGNPIILLSDAQTTGGYPKIAHVITGDLRILAQKKRRDTISFQEVTLEEALRIYQQLERIKRQIEAVMNINKGGLS
ncbi:biotin-dependent carboxyltransferase family protein [Bacillus spongiae]|uniref:Biotin-dependent carboxyltransferase family protein n=1 Tax=Bacillus spongiae TaxID=2683610 RepID=A0ABU8HHJ9_9BACI